MNYMRVVPRHDLVICSVDNCSKWRAADIQAVVTVNGVTYIPLLSVCHEHANDIRIIGEESQWRIK